MSRRRSSTLSSVGFAPTWEATSHGHPPVSDINEGTLGEIMRRLDEQAEEINALKSKNECIEDEMEKIRLRNAELEEKLRCANGTLESLLSIIEKHATPELQSEMENLFANNPNLQARLRNMGPKKNWWKFAFLVLLGGGIGFVLGGPVGGCAGWKLAACTAAGAGAGAAVDYFTS